MVLVKLMEQARKVIVHSKEIKKEIEQKFPVFHRLYKL